MKMLRIGFVFAFLALTSVLASAKDGDKIEDKRAEQGIQFTEARWAAILKKAKEEKKIIFFDAYTTWCGPCKSLEKNVFTRSDVGEVFNKNFINVRFDMESGEGLQLAKKYPLEGYPTLLFIDSKGKVVKKVMGYQNPEALISIAKKIPKGAVPM
jgi:thioredoxin 1